MKFSTFFNPIAAAFRAAVLALSRLDGKPGLTSADFAFILEKVAAVDTSSLTGKDKADWVAKRITGMLGDKIPQWPWIPHAIGWATYAVAVRLKLIKR